MPIHPTRRFSRITLPAIFAATAWGVSDLCAQTWDGGGANNNWNTIANWNPDAAIANDGTANLTFSGNVRLAPTLDVDYSIRGITYTATASAFTIGPATRLLTIGAGGIDYQLSNGATQRINTDIKLSANQTWLVEDSNDLIVSGDINLNGFNFNPVAAFGSVGLPNMTFSGAISGTGSIVKDGYGELTLSGAAANTWVGSTTIYGVLGLHKTAGVNAVPGDVLVPFSNSGLKWYANNQIPDSAKVTLTGYGFANLGAFSETIDDLVIGTPSVNTQSLISGTGTLTVAGGNISANSIDFSTISCNLRLGALSTTFDISGAAFFGGDGGLIVSDTISQATAGSSITKAGTAVLRLSVANTYTGGTTLQAGKLALGIGTAVGSGPLTLAGGTLVPEANITLTNAVNVTGTTTFAPSTNSVGATMSGVISGTGTLVVSGFGLNPALTLSGAAANTNTGGVSILQGKVTLSKTAGMAAIAGPINLGDGSASGLDAILTQTASNQIADSVTLTTHVDGQYNLNGFSETLAGLVMYSGQISTGTGTLTLAAAGITLPSSAEFSSALLINGKLSLLGQTRTFDIAAGRLLDVGMVILDGGVNQTGGGTMALSAINTYTGTTTVSGGGTLQVYNSAPLGTGATTNALVLSNGTLKLFTNLSSPRPLRFDTATIDATGFTFDSSGTAATTFAGALALTGGTLRLRRSGGTVSVTPGASITVSTGATLELSGALSFSQLGDNINHVDVVNNGTFDITGDVQQVGNIDGSGNTNIIGSSTITANRVRQNSIAVGGLGSALYLRPGGTNASVSVLNTLTMPNMGNLLDLANNKLILVGNNPGTWNISAYTGATGLIATGRNGNTTPLWDGYGIVTSQSTAVAGNLHSIGIARGLDIGINSTGMWAGQTVSSGDTLVMYTYGGDSNLDGKLNIDDYIRIDQGIAASLTGWSNGDFNYDGVVSIDDYLTVIDLNVAAQGPPFLTGAGLGGAIAAPEPAAGAGLALAGWTLLRRARRNESTRLNGIVRRPRAD